MSRALRRTLAVIGLAAGVVSLVWHYSRPEPTAVTLATVERGTVNSTVANTRAGTVNACRRARITPAASGQVAQLLVHEGDRVNKGDLLLELWNEDLAAELTLSQRDARAAKARVEEACVRAENAQREAQREGALYQKGLVSSDASERAATDAAALAAACEATRGNAGVADARVAVARAALERTRLRAPFNGTVAEVTGEVGEFVTPSPPGIPTPPAIDLVDTDCLYVTAPIDEVDAPAIRPGMPAQITLDAFPGRSFAGHVRRVAPYVLDREKQARTVDVEIDFDNPGELRNLLPGYSADVEIILESHLDALRVPTQAVLEGNRVLLWPPATGVLEQRDFVPGLSNWNWTEVTSGLQAGERIVTSVEREGVQAGVQVVPDPAAQGKTQ